MMKEKPTLKQLLESSEGKKLLFLGKEEIFTPKERERFLKRFKMTAVTHLDADVAGVVEHHRLNPVEEDISNEAYEQQIPLYKLTEFEQLLSEEIDDDALLMAIKLGNDQERVVRLLGNEHLSDALFVRLLKLYTFDEEEEDNRQDRDVIMYTLRRYIDIKPNEEDLLYSYLTLRRLATEATDPNLLDALMGFPNFEFLVRGREKITLQETIARNPNLSEEGVRKLLSFREEKVLAALAGNESVTLEVLRHLLSKGSDSILKALATNTKIDDEIFGALLEKDAEILSLLLLRQPIGTARLSQIESKGIDAEHFALLGANESLSKVVMDLLLEKEDPQLLEMLSANPTLSSDRLERIYQLDLEETFPSLARNPATPLWILQAFYEEYSDDMQMLAALAHNPSLPEPLLRALFEKDKLIINRGLATNASLPAELLDILKVDTRLQNELAQNEQLMQSYDEVLKQNKAMMNV
jgi:hypothetical protein